MTSKEQSQRAMSLAALPLVSVILPTYNRAHTLKRAIDSVLNQTYKNIELLVIDDGSTDGTPELLSNYSDARLKILETSARGGAAAARNLGLRSAQGEFVAFQDSDDCWLVEKLERQVDYLTRHPKSAVCVSAYINIPVDRQEPTKYCGYCLMDVERIKDVSGLFLYGYQFSTPAWLVRKSILDEVGYFEETFPTWEDWELSVRLDHAGRFVYLDEVLHIAFEMPGSVKKNTARFTDVVEIAMQRHAQWITKSKKTLAGNYLAMSYWRREGGNYASARKYWFKAARTDFFYWRVWAVLGRRFYPLFFKWKNAEIES